jgi:cytochrome c peroxidase
MPFMLRRTKPVTVGLATTIFATVITTQGPFAEAALNPPPAYVLGEDGTTRLTLEQAGILNTVEGRKYGTILGKALFWDIQVGSDGTACASCHITAGADTRIKNQLHPGFLDVTKNNGAGDTAFGSERSDTGTVNHGNMPSNHLAGPNYTLIPSDMPLHQLEDETNRNSRIITTTNDRVSSQGAFDSLFTKVKRKHRLQDRCKLDSATFSIGGKAVRQVEPRNTPSTINAVFNHRNFWDGRANNLFNGVGVFGMRDINGDPNKRLIILDETGNPQLGYLKIEDASLASQAVGPPLSDLEMSCDGRTFPHLGRKMIKRQPLEHQRVSNGDSVLGPYVHKSGVGLARDYDYISLIQKTFPEKYWKDKNKYDIVNGILQKDPKGFTQMEMNFSMFWGIAIMLYESTLVSDQSEFDSRQADGRLVINPAFGNPNNGRCFTNLPTPLNGDEELLLRGCTIFARANNGNFSTNRATDGLRGGGCFTCHISVGGGGGRTNATPGNPPTLSFSPMLAENTRQAGETFPIFLPVADVKGVRALRDQGFAGIGLRPAFTDQMSGGTDPYGNPLSFGGQLWKYLDGLPNAVLDPPVQRAISAGTAPARVVGGGGGTFAKLEVDGSSKAPILRNVALTPPYFSWGGYPSLRQVLKVYNRGMNRRDITATNGFADRPAGSTCETGDDSGSGPDGKTALTALGSDCGTNTTGAIVALGLADCEAPVGTEPRTECETRGLNASTDDLAALERFLKSLTDERVRCDQAPFDHPSIPVPTGHSGRDKKNDGMLDDIIFTLPAVGAAGYAGAQAQFCTPNSGDLFAPGMQARTGGL